MTQAEALSYLGDSREVACEAFFDCHSSGSDSMGPRLNWPKMSHTSPRHRKPPTADDNHSRPSPTLCACHWDGLPLRRDRRRRSLEQRRAFRIDVLKEFDQLWREVSESSVGCDTTRQKALEFSYDNGRGDGTSHWFCAARLDRRNAGSVDGRVRSAAILGVAARPRGQAKKTPGRVTRTVTSSPAATGLSAQHPDEQFLVPARAASNVSCP